MTDKAEKTPRSRSISERCEPGSSFRVLRTSRRHKKRAAASDLALANVHLSRIYFWVGSIYFWAGSRIHV